MGKKRTIVLGGLLILAGSVAAQRQARSGASIDLAGSWSFAMDPSDVGVTKGWTNVPLSGRVVLPGSMTTNGKGDEVTAQTRWTGNFSRSAYYTDPVYARYRRAGNVKVPFCLQPEKYYVGPAWYSRSVTVPAGWKGRHIDLFLERCHWETRLFVDGREAGMQNALGAPQTFDLDFLTPGVHRLTLRVDNRIKEINPGIDAHSVSDNTQTNWNGVIGRMTLESRPAVWLSDVQVFPDVEAKIVHVRATVRNISGMSSTKQLVLSIKGVGFPASSFLPVEKNVSVIGDSVVVETDYPMGEHPRLWDEFHPNLYSLTAALGNDVKRVDFGMRSFKTKGTVFEVNGRRIFLRGTLECAIFPLTGYPPTDVAAWSRIFRIARSFGLNHIRFHSWCPPEAAFEAADRAGFYLSIECSAWATVGDGRPIDQWLYQESSRIVQAFGNHPSFCMMPYGNEPGGKHLVQYLTGFVEYWKTRDNRRVYTTASGWPSVAENDYNVVPAPRIQHWGEGLKSLINSEAPRTDFDWDTLLPSHKIPTVSHEIGQWCVYPDFKERKQYTGILKAKNFDIYYDFLQEHGMSALADSFLLASGKLQVLCYKADIEAALRTPGFGGFQLLDLHDFPGQGTALVGVLNPFWREKGYVTAKEYRRFCNTTVPLVRMPKLVYLNHQALDATVEVAHFGPSPLVDVTPQWSLRDKRGKLIGSGKLDKTTIAIGNGVILGKIHQGLGLVQEASELTLTVKVDSFSNSWHVFVYPAETPRLTRRPYFAQRLDAAALDSLRAGGMVLLSVHKGAVKPEMGGEVKMGFSSIFWNTAWTNGQAPWTLGILCNPAHPALREFPTEYFSDYQWWDAMTHGSVFRLDSLDSRIRPIVRVIDDWNQAWPLGLIFECRVGPGRLLVSGVDLATEADRRPEARQLRYSLEKYMTSSGFQPEVQLSPNRLKALFK